MSSEIAISAAGLSKCYTLYERPSDRLKQLLRLGKATQTQQFWALKDVGFEVGRGEVVGIIGRNGSGKSTLLQLVCGTLTPTSGALSVKGRIAALLELGAGFNPEFSGRENVYMSAAVMGLTQREISAQFDGIVDFSGVRDFIDQPVKTYSSGMYMRLAFSVAISVDPDILVIDEALSVGDGAFARKSFERIMAMKAAGKTILFCSHSLYQVELLCSRVLWLDQGDLRAQGAPGEVVRAYSTFLDSLEANERARTPAPSSDSSEVGHAMPSLSRITGIDLRVDGEHDKIARSGESTVEITIDFAVEAGECPSVAVAFFTQDGRCVSSAGTVNDGIGEIAAQSGNARVTAVFDRLPLLRGEYTVAVWLLCERALFTNEAVEQAGRLVVTQCGLEQGLVSLPHRWEVQA